MTYRISFVLFKLIWKLSDDPVAEHVGHLQDLLVNFFIRGDVGGPIPLAKEPPLRHLDRKVLFIMI